MIVSEKDKLFDERVEALVKLYRRAEFYLKQGFLESIVCEFHRKKVEMIMQAETKGEITEILKLSKPHFDGKKFVYTSPYAVEEEELLLWSLTSLQGPLRDEGYRRYRELFEKCLPEMAEKIACVVNPERKPLAVISRTNSDEGPATATYARTLER